MRKVQESIGTFAAAFGITRDVLRRILAEGAVQPCGKRGGHPIYELGEVFGAAMAQNNSENLNPHARRALAQAVKVEDEIAARRGEMVEAFDVEQRMGLIFKAVVRAFETAVDTVERDVGLSSEQAGHLERHFDRCRDYLYQEVVRD